MGEREELFELQYYAEQYCEGWCKNAAPEANFEDCGGCRARLALRAHAQSPLDRDLRYCLRDSACPRPANSEPDDLTVGQCFDKGQCGCQNGVALRAPEAADAGAVAPVGFFIGNADDGYHQVEKEYEGEPGLTPLYASPTAAGIADAVGVADEAMTRIWSEWFTFYTKHFRGNVAISAADQMAFYEIAQPILRALSAPVAGATYTSEDMKRYKNCPNDLEPEDCKNVCGEACSAFPSTDGKGGAS